MVVAEEESGHGYNDKKSSSRTGSNMIREKRCLKRWERLRRMASMA